MASSNFYAFQLGIEGGRDIFQARPDMFVTHLFVTQHKRQESG